ncbi:MAG: sodium:alanine symporter [Candidatus Lambdaproteobacteria bacterium RIFOXYD1_FULL_56_27]|uniref:Sodium:alanine symporter n=1 Tax=Candidatus Lambdaproteobacteria bacterium RIFOXYD2_FULL_56_26 TaxID=1817773 RepID=A0A1F6GSD7_9PROT|nr:MAG: sodium:alanine symporter [Candidatus Lambdaproteobacteria bacterium RIFOXYD2_FULL_56_26]OGH01324.1 MAG: sodium:alanine symporter [Candidatus Lambdaproteobacteria bacterium RIFOXYC1_FULL_56_13]OGH06864.1 MAG: sodium:alanine symporter [Candidatus Lambdaproteobacteria bacterium RIFOXYD1_FULL_56_27]
MIESWFQSLNSLVWGPAMLVLILGTGLYLMVGLRGFPVRQLWPAFVLMWKGRKSVGEQGDITPWGAAMTALAATIGTGNIAGVATAIFLGGPGALFWMWCTAMVGMATKYAESLLAVHFREVDPKGDHIGGPMFYIKNGLGKGWAWMATAFAVFAALAGFGIGNMVQANSIAELAAQDLGLAPWITGVLIALVVGLVLLGGVRRIAEVSGALVPLMAALYFGGGLLVVAMNLDQVPKILALVLTNAFTGTAAEGGFAGAGVWMALRFGVARGIFSNEAGLGSAPIAHAAAQTDSPVRQGMVAMLGTFIDTILVCSVTGFVILLSGTWTSGATGAALSSLAFTQTLGVLGHYVVSIGLFLFTFTTLIGWSFYGEKAVEYLFGVKGITPYRVLWILAIPLGATVKLELVWLIADTLNALMALPNLVALLALSPLVFRLTREWRR